MKNFSAKQLVLSSFIIALLSAPAMATTPVCKVRTMGGGSLGMTFSFWKQVPALSLEDCQEAAKALVGQTETSEDLLNPSGEYGYYRAWKAWYKWNSDGETSKGSFTSDDVFAGPSDN